MKQNEKLYNENPKGLFQILKETIKDKTLCRPYVSKFGKLQHRAYPLRSQTKGKTQ